MKKILLSSFLLFILAACNNEEKPVGQEPAEDDINAATNFVNAALKGNFKDARSYAVKDSTNQQFLDTRERIYAIMNPSTKADYASASIRVYDVNRLNDSTTMVVYANSFKNDKDTLRVVKTNSTWLVDTKFLWSHGEDSVNIKELIKPDSTGK